MPEDVDEADFACGTCALSVFVRIKDNDKNGDVEVWDENNPGVVPNVNWIGNGVKGGWDCAVNGDCTHLEGGEERTWLVLYFFLISVVPHFISFVTRHSRSITPFALFHLQLLALWSIHRHTI